MSLSDEDRAEIRRIVREELLAALHTPEIEFEIVEAFIREVASQRNYHLEIALKERSNPEG